MAAVTARPLLVRVRAAGRRPDDPVVEIDPGATEARAPATEAPATVTLRPPAGDGVGWQLEVVVGGWRFELEVEDGAQAALRAKARRGLEDETERGPVELRAIIPGRVVSVDVAEGEQVDAGGHLLVLEAMKMQNELRAPAAGRVARIAVTAGMTVDRGDLLLILEPKAAAEPGS